jgi:hypothetical protein
VVHGFDDERVAVRPVVPQRGHAGKIVRRSEKASPVRLQTYRRGSAGKTSFVLSLLLALRASGRTDPYPLFWKPENSLGPSQKCGVFFILGRSVRQTGFAERERYGMSRGLINHSAMTVPPALS